jgi:phosphatidylserine/phosphatidylglycerophosphate/cardiolipin synthase-like enzyme
MAKFVNGSGVLSVLTDIITNAERKLLLISPYLNIPVQTKNYLKSTDKKGIPITIIYRTNEKITNPDLYFLKNLKNLTLGHCENLHSKCYINENEGLITSMNLYEHSLTHNWEMGLRFSRQEDPLVYDDVLKKFRIYYLNLQNTSIKRKRDIAFAAVDLWGKLTPTNPFVKSVLETGQDITDRNILKYTVISAVVTLQIVPFLLGNLCVKIVQISCKKMTIHNHFKKIS